MRRRLNDFSRSALTCLEAAIEKPRYASGSDFDKPFFVIVHEQVLEQFPVKDTLRGERVRAELAYIKSNYEFVVFGDYELDPKLSKKRHILCAGFFEGHSVLKVYQNLKNRGYDVCISREGVLPESAFQID